MRHVVSLAVFAFLLGTLTGCSGDAIAPLGPERSESSPSQAWGPEVPPFHLEVVLRGDGFGLVKFRQPNDADFIIYLDTWVRGLEPNTSYSLQRAVDTTVDDVCTSETWLTLGKGLVPQAITTDDTGTGREQLFRDVTGVPLGMQFDIHFRVIDAQTAEVVLESECYQYGVSL